MNDGPVVVVGDANVDLMIRLPDGKQGTPGAVQEPRMFGGGTAANTAVALARLGTPVYFAGTVGDDGYGRVVMREFGEVGIDAGGVRVHPTAFTPTVIAMIQPDGERWLVVWPPTGGAHIHLRPDDLDLARIRSAAWLHTSGMCLRAEPVRSAVLFAMEQARAAGVPVSIDLNLRLELWGWADRMRTVVARAIALANVVIGSGTDELMPTTGAKTAEKAAQMLANGVRTVIAREGVAGTLAVTPQGEVVRAPIYPVPVVDTLGAGDAFDAGFIAARVAGLDLVDALRWGNAAAALIVAQVGARGLLSRKAVERFVYGTTG